VLFVGNTLLRDKFTDSLKTKYKETFGIETSRMDNHWTPKTICVTCRLKLTKRKTQTFASPMIWRKPIDHETDCYFCLTNVCGYNRITKSSISYASVKSVTFPILLGVAQNNEKHINTEENEAALEMSTNEILADSHAEDIEMQHEASEESEDESDENPNGFTQNELNDLVRDAGLSKEIFELLASRLKEKYCLAPGTRITFYRNREILNSENTSQNPIT